MMFGSFENVSGAWEDEINKRARGAIEATLIYGSNDSS